MCIVTAESGSNNAHLAVDLEFCCSKPWRKQKQSAEKQQHQSTTCAHMPSESTSHLHLLWCDISFKTLCAGSTLVALWEDSKSINILDDGLDVVDHSKTKLADQIQQCHPNIDCKQRFPAISTPEPAETISEAVAARVPRGHQSITKPKYTHWHANMCLKFQI